jgi:hypothetical protein
MFVFEIKYDSSNCRSKSMVMKPEVITATIASAIAVILEGMANRLFV